MKAWHFIKEDRRLGYGDNRLVVDGETLHYLEDAPIELCERGLHFSVNILDALQYAPGSVACYVEIPDDSILGDDKGVAVSRTVLKSIDATEILVKFAILQTMPIYKEPRWTKWAENWLSGKDRSRDSAARAARAARAYAAAATTYAAYAADAAAYAADATARAAYAAYAADAAAYAADAAARAAYAAYAYIKQKQNKVLESMLLEAMGIA